MTADLGTSSRSTAAVAPGSHLGEFAIEGPLRRTAAAEVLRANHPSLGSLTLYVVHAELARNPAVRDAILAAARTAVAVPEHKHLVRTLGAGVADGRLWVATEELDGSTLKELLTRKRDAGAGGFGARGAGNLVLGVAGALAAAGMAHGALSTESVVVNRAGRVRLADLALGAGTAAAVAGRLLAAGSHLAPEIATGGGTAVSADVYGLGALLYEALLGRPLERGGPRPSEAVAGLTTQVDELIARACHREPDRRFGSAEVFKELVADALGRGGAVEEEASPAAGQSGAYATGSAVSAVAAPSRQSLAQAIAQPGASAPTADPALSAALADTTEKWLIAKGRLDYGPYSLAEVLEQIRSHQIVSGNVIVDKDTGGRVDIADHPLLGPLVDRARQDHDMKRRADAEVAHESLEKKRHLTLYAFIGVGVVAVGLAVYFVVQSARADETKAVSGVSKLAQASLEVKMSEPKAPPRRAPAGGGGGRRSGGGGGGGGTETLALDMSGDEDGSGTPLDMGTVFKVYSRYGGQLGGCLASTGSRSASIAIIIDGPSGRVNWVRVNGEAGGSLHGCLTRVLKSMKFPATDGPRTRAEFDIGL